MISKRVAMNSAAKSSFAGLVSYMTDAQDKNTRVGEVRLTNCASEELEWAVREVQATQQQNTRATGDKTYHLLISFAPGESPSPEILRDVEGRICAAMGYAEHQRISVIHSDTDVLHIHIAINKIHPERLTMHEPYRDFYIRAQICARLEIEHGLQRVDHAAQRSLGESRAADMEAHSGFESLLGWIKRECGEQMAAATSWAELHQVLGASGLEIHTQGNGLAVTADGGGTVKASSIDRAYAMKKLEGKFGPFVPAHKGAAIVRVTRRYEKGPMRSKMDTVELYAKYKDAQLGGQEGRAGELVKIRAKRDRLIEDAKRSGRLKRAAIKLIKGAGIGRKAMYSSTSSTLKGDIENINKQYLKERGALTEKFQRQTWADWLQSHAKAGDQEALQALRARASAQSLKGNTVGGEGVHSPPAAGLKQDSVTKRGTVIYRTDAGPLRDGGARLKPAPGADQGALQEALKMALRRYGKKIHVGGTAAFREQIAQAAVAAKLPITFDDPALERRRQQLFRTTTKGSKHEQRTGRSAAGDNTADRRANDRQHAGADGRAATGVSRARTWDGLGDGRAEATGNVPVSRFTHKPNIAGIGRKPPPLSQNRLRGLSELGLVRIDGGGAVLLPGHVPGVLDKQKTERVASVRRDDSGAGQRVNISTTAADKYIAEREQKRALGLDISKHSRYTSSLVGAAVFAGIRQIEGQALALLKRGEEVLVMPIGDGEAQRLKRVAIGAAVTVTPLGSIKSKGRSR